MFKKKNITMSNKTFTKYINDLERAAMEGEGALFNDTTNTRRVRNILFKELVDTHNISKENAILIITLMKIWITDNLDEDQFNKIVELFVKLFNEKIQMLKQTYPAWKDVDLVLEMSNIRLEIFDNYIW